MSVQRSSFSTNYCAHVIILLMLKGWALGCEEQTWGMWNLADECSQVQDGHRWNGMWVNKLCFCHIQDSGIRRMTSSDQLGATSKDPVSVSILVSQWS